MWRKLVAIVFVIVIPAGASARSAQGSSGESRLENRTRSSQRAHWRPTTFLDEHCPISAGGVLTMLGAVEFGDDEDGPDDGEELDDSDDGEDSDGWRRNSLMGGGIASAALGIVMLITGRRSGPVMTIHPKGIAVRHAIRF